MKRQKFLKQLSEFPPTFYANSHSLTIFFFLRYVCEDHPEVREYLTTEYPGARTTPDSFDSMLGLCTTYNKAVDNMISVIMFVNTQCLLHLP